jgi:phospholipid/cholesterol/gamma-HCH transport system substrate-binding protein
MNGRREQIWVGVFVLIAASLLIITVLAVAGTFSSGGINHHTSFKFAGGLQPGDTVRYGGMKAGRVSGVHVDPQDSTRIEIDFSVLRGIPVKTDSVAKITTLGALGDNYVEVTTGSKDSALLPPGSAVKSAETVGIGDLGNMLGGLAPLAQQVLQTLDARLVELQVTIARVNDLLNDKNRKSISNSLGNLSGMLQEDRPKISSTLTNVQKASDRLMPLLDDLKATMAQANATLSHVDAVVVENRQDIRATVVNLRETMVTASELLEQLKYLTDSNEGNIDETLTNIRVTTENLKQLTDTLKRKPSLLIRGNAIKDRKPGGK